MSTALALPDHVRAELVPEGRDTDEALAMIEALTITTAEDLEFAADLLCSVSDRYKVLEDKRTSVTKPMLAAKREIDSWFAPVTGPLKRAESILREKIGAFHVLSRGVQEAAMLEVAAGGSTALAPVPTAAGVNVRELWDFEITDAAEVPRKFLCVDFDALRKHAAMADTERTPPVPVAGVRWFKRGQVRVSGR
jgi:hypothetical protein